MSARNEWKSAQDPKSGRTYYYNAHTKETTWTKPLALASPGERERMIREDREKREFFRDMESNIKRKIARAQEIQQQSLLSSSPVLNTMTEEEYHALFAGLETGRRRMSSVSGSIPRRIRTISTIDDEILISMKKTESKQEPPIVQISRPSRLAVAPLNLQALKAESKSSYDSPIDQGRRIRTGSMDHPDELPLPMKLDAKEVQKARALPSPRVPSKTKKKRRNSTGTIYISHTMSQQDDDSTIHCVCVVIRAHMLDAQKEGVANHPDFLVFDDMLSSPKGKQLSLTDVPTLQEVKDFFNALYKKSQLESDCIIMALIYCERLVKETKGKLSIRTNNWKSILFACLVMASKVWDDLSMWNVDFSQVIKGFNLQRVNDLELAMLSALKYCIRVTASEYAKYYFHLRSMSARLDLSNTTSVLAPLDMAGARRLQLATEQYELSSSGAAAMAGLAVSRRHSVDISGAGAGLSASGPIQGAMGRQCSDNTTPVHQSGKSVALEQLVHSDHNEASGAPKAASTKMSGKKKSSGSLNVLSSDSKLSALDTSRTEAKTARK